MTLSPDPLSPPCNLPHTTAVSLLSSLPVLNTSNLGCQTGVGIGKPCANLVTMETFIAILGVLFFIPSYKMWSLNSNCFVFPSYLLSALFILLLTSATSWSSVPSYSPFKEKQACPESFPPCLPLLWGLYSTPLSQRVTMNLVVLLNHSLLQQSFKQLKNP